MKWWGRGFLELLSDVVCIGRYLADLDGEDPTDRAMILEETRIITVSGGRQVVTIPTPYLPFVCEFGWRE